MPGVLTPQEVQDLFATLPVHPETHVQRRGQCAVARFVNRLEAAGRGREGREPVQRAAVEQVPAEATGQPADEEAGFEPVSLVNLAYTDEEDVVAASDDVVIDLADRARTPDAEAVFLACTNLPTVPLLGGLRERLGVPVLTANQVLIEAALRRAAASAIA